MGATRFFQPKSTDSEGDEGPQHEVILDYEFWMKKTEVTQGEYEAVMGTNPSQVKIGPALPVDSVTWEEATSYCQKLTERERNREYIKEGYIYRLPTEAE